MANTERNKQAVARLFEAFRAGDRKRERHVLPAHVGQALKARRARAAPETRATPSGNVARTDNAARSLYGAERRNRWQLVADARSAKSVQSSRNRCRRLRPLAAS